MVLTAQRLYIIFMTLYTDTEGEKSTDVNVGVLSDASALRECLMVVSRGRNCLMICAKCGGLASSNEIFTVGCSIVEVAFEFLISTD